jgi:hypothetical protein
LRDIANLKEKGVEKKANLRKILENRCLTDTADPKVRERERRIEDK